MKILQCRWSLKFESHTPFFAPSLSEVHLFVTLRQKRFSYRSRSGKVHFYLHRNTLSFAMGMEENGNGHRGMGRKWE